jgi:pantetheine-phosphate adenylyltransferase
MSKRTAIFPGSFDPFTNGHADVVRRALPLFDHIIIGLGNNSAKSRYFPLAYMQERIGHTFSHEPKVSVAVFSGLTANFAREVGAQFLLRGLRNTTDFEYENTLAQANIHVLPGLETIFIITTPALAGINSTIIRDLHKYGAEVGGFLPYELSHLPLETA